MHDSLEDVTLHVTDKRETSRCQKPNETLGRLGWKHLFVQSVWKPNVFFGNDHSDVSFVAVRAHHIPTSVI